MISQVKMTAEEKINIGSIYDLNQRGDVRACVTIWISNVYKLMDFLSSHKSNIELYQLSEQSSTTSYKPLSYKKCES